MNDRRPSLEQVFSPRGVAVVGVTPQERGSYVNDVLKSLKQAGFPAVYPVNPRYAEVQGLPCYPGLRAVPGIVDHVVVGIPAEAALSLLDDCAAKGVKSVHFFTAGFSESGYAERAEMERAMLSKAKAGGFRIIGPNCVGMYVPKSHLTNGSRMPREPGPIAFLSQSGGHGHDLPYYGSARGLRFSKVVSYGNALDVDENELLEYLAHDEETEIIAAYIEGIKDGNRFQSILRKAASRKPVVIYKGGRSEAGKRTTRSHTASIASSVSIFDSLCRQTNTIQVDDTEELMDALVALRFARPVPRGNGVAVFGTGGGPSVLASDGMERAGLHLPSLSPEVQSELRHFLPLAGGIFSNPVDATNLTFPEAIGATVRVLSKVPDVHMLIYHLGFHPVSYWGDGRFSSPAFLEPVVNAFVETREKSGKPVLVALRPPPDRHGMEDFLAVRSAFVSAGLPVFHSLIQLAKAMVRVVAWDHAKNID